MSTIGLVYNAVSSTSSNGEQVMLLRTLQDNERATIGARAYLTGGQQQQQQQQQPPPHKNNVSVISLNGSLDANTCKSNGQALPAYDPSRLKKHGKNGQPPPIAVAKRNARERNRVKQVNNGFATLRQHIPSHVAQGYGDRGKKLSKVETLRMAVEYIRGLQRLLAEADGIELELDEQQLGNANNQSPRMIASPTGSLYSSSTHNGSAEVFGLDAEHQQEVDLMDEEDEAEADDDHQEQQRYNAGDEVVRRRRRRRSSSSSSSSSSELKDSRPAKRSRDEPRRIRVASRLSENQNRERCRRREDNYYKQAFFGDEENIEPLGNRNNSNSNNNNNNNVSNNNNNVLGSFSPILVQMTTSASNNLSCIKREVQQLLDVNESGRSSEDEQQSGLPNEGVILASSSSPPPPPPYTGEIFIENPETGRLVPLKIEEHEAQLVYVSAAEPAYYKAELLQPESAAELSWWEQECIVQQMQQQQPTAPAAQRPLAHV